jgi:hypothetical protein
MDEMLEKYTQYLSLIYKNKTLGLKHFDCALIVLIGG